MRRIDFFFFFLWDLVNSESCRSVKGRGTLEPGFRESTKVSGFEIKNTEISVSNVFRGDGKRIEESNYGMVLILVVY